MTDAPRPRRRWRIALAVSVLLCAIVAVALNRLLQPERVTAMLASQVRSIGLDLHVDGAAHYRFLPRIEAVLPMSRVVSDKTPLLAAQSIHARMPWHSLWSGPLVIDDLAIENPVLDLDALRAWLAARPATNAPAPDVRFRIRVDNAKIVSGGQTIAEGVSATLANQSDVAAWLAHWSPATPAAQLVPPLSGTLDANSLRIGETRVEGLHVEIGDDGTQKKP